MRVPRRQSLLDCLVPLRRAAWQGIFDLGRRILQEMVNFIHHPIPNDHWKVVVARCAAEAPAPKTAP